MQLRSVRALPGARSVTHSISAFIWLMRLFGFDAVAFFRLKITSVGCGYFFFFKLSALESKSRFLLTSFQVIEVFKLTLFAIFLFRFAELFIPIVFYLFCG